MAKPMLQADVCDVVVVGAGVAGLTAAVRLVGAGLDTVVLEAGQTPGGNVQTEEVQGFLLERGPHTFMASADAIFEIGEQVGASDALTGTRPEAEARFIARNGRIHAMPTGAWSFLSTSLLSWRSRFELATEPFRIERGQPDDTAATFFARRFGPEAARVLAGAFVSGVYAGDPERLSAPAAFPLFWGFEQECGSMIRGAMRHGRRRKAERKARGESGPARKGLYSYSGGLGTFSKAAAAHLGDRVKLASPALSLERGPGGTWVVGTSHGAVAGRALVLAVPPGDAGALARGIDPELGDLVAGIPMAPVAVVQIGFRSRAAEIPEGFGFLVPRGEGIRTLGVLFPSRLFDGRAPEGGDLLAGFVGGVSDPGALDLDDGALLDVVLGDLGRLTGLQKRPDFVDVRRHRAAIPQFVLGHLERMERLRGRAAGHPGLFLAGNWLSGVGMKDAVRSGVAAASDVAAWLEAPASREEAHDGA
jgi:protoporphyrinogen/coproporphyrinogen III oxidase